MNIVFCRQLSARVQEMQSHISDAMQNYSVSLGSRAMLHPLSDTVKYNDSLVRNLTLNVAENFNLSNNSFL